MDSNFNGVEKGTFSSSQILDITGAMNFLGMTRSAIYKKTSSRLIPHYKKGKKIYFDKNELIDWVKESKVSTMAEIERKANSYVLKRRR